MTRGERRLPGWVLPALVAVLPCATAAVRAWRAHWLPIGDNGYFAVRARDVLTADHPLLGAWSSGSQAVGVDVNNLGPMQLDLLWPFVKVLGLGPGTILAVTLLNGLCAAGVAIVGHRRAGAAGAWIGAAVAAGLSWTLGSELLLEPRQHHALVLPFLLCLVLAWSLADGDVALLPFAAATATFVAQTHLTFLLPLGAVGVVALIAMARRTRAPIVDRAEPRAGLRGPVLVTVGVLALLWAQTAVEELQGGNGNVSSVVEAAQVDTPTYGLSDGSRALAQIIRPAVGWLPPSFVDFDPNAGGISTGTAVVVLGGFAVALAALAWSAHRRGDQTLLALLLIDAAALAGGWYSVATSPSGRFGVLAANFRFLWPIGALLTLTLALGALRSWVRMPSPRVVVALATVAVTVSLWAVPASHQTRGARDSRALIEVSRDLLDQLHDFEFDGTLLIDRRGTAFGEPYSYVLFAGLQDQGIPWESALSQDARRFGERKAYDGTADATLTLATGVPAEAPRPGSERIAFASWLNEAEHAELLELLAEAEVGPLSAADQARALELRHRRAAGTVAVWLTRGTPPPPEAMHRRPPGS